MSFITIDQPRSIKIKQWVLLTSVLTLFGCESGGSSGNKEVTPLETDANKLVIEQPALQWSVCEEAPLLDCTTLMVPMDYSNPSGRVISIAMARSSANPSTQNRTLLLNPGGPGGGGIDLLRAVPKYFDVPTSVENTFDFVSFDPRGIGKSTPVDCDLNALYRQDVYPTSSEELAQVFSASQEFADECFETEGEYLQHLGSMNVVRDMDEMRKALGLSEIDFLGYSYGTRLAGLYMQLFPQKTGRFILDGSMSPEPSLERLVRGGLRPAQINIETLAAACNELTVSCIAGDFLTKLQKKVDEVGSGPNTSEAFQLLSILQLASTIPGFEIALIGSLSDYVDTDDIASLEYLYELLGLGEELESEGAFNVTAYTAILCADDPTRPTIEYIESLQASHNAESDLFAELYYANVALCFGWPESIDPIPQISTNQAPASLVIGGPTDAQTPLIFAQQMANAVGGQFLYSEHDGHTTVFTGGNQCTELAAEEFLTQGVLPTTDRCSAFGPVSSNERREVISVSHLSRALLLHNGL